MRRRLPGPAAGPALPALRIGEPLLGRAAGCFPEKFVEFQQVLQDRSEHSVAMALRVMLRPDPYFDFPYNDLVGSSVLSMARRREQLDGQPLPTSAIPRTRPSLNRPLLEVHRASRATAHPIPGRHILGVGCLVADERGLQEGPVHEGLVRGIAESGSGWPSIFPYDAAMDKKRTARRDRLRKIEIGVRSQHYPSGPWPRMSLRS